MHQYGTGLLIAGIAIGSVIAFEGVRHLRKGMRDGRIFITIGFCIAANAILNTVMEHYRSSFNPVAYSCLHTLNIVAAMSAFTLFCFQITKELRGRNQEDNAEPTSPGDVANRAAPEK